MPIPKNVKKSLYLKYRPTSFDALVGQDHVQKILRSATKEGKISQAYLLVGPRGTGKTTTARLIAKALNCTVFHKDGSPDFKNCPVCMEIQDGKFLDVIEIDAASNTGVDDMRDLIEKAKLAPSLSNKKVYIIDEVHMLSKSAFNALLKTLEEPPSHVHFVLATTEVNKIPPTIISRCQRFDFKRIATEAIVKRLQYICQQENVEADNKALQMIASNSDGGLRDAISLLEQVIINNQVTAQTVESSLGTVKVGTIAEFINILLEKKTNLALNLINDLYQNGVSLAQFKKETLQYLRQLMIESFDSDPNSSKVSRYLKLIEEINNMDINSSLIPQFPFELMICKITLSEDKVIQKENLPQQKNEPVKKDLSTQEESPIASKEVSEETKKQIEVDDSEYKFTSDDLPDQKFTVKPTLDKVRDDWFKIIERCKKPTLKLALREAFLEKLENDVLTLSFRSEFHFNKIKTNENKKETEDLLKNYFDTAVAINTVLSKIDPIKKPEEEKIPAQDTKKKTLEEDIPGDDGLDISEVEDLFSS